MVSNLDNTHTKDPSFVPTKQTSVAAMNYKAQTQILLTGDDGISAAKIWMIKRDVLCLCFCYHLVALWVFAAQ